MPPAEVFCQEEAQVVFYEPAGVVLAYRLLLKAGQRPHFIAFYVLHMALQGRPWNDCKGEEKKALRIKFDALKAANHDKGRSDFEAALDAIGVVEKKV